MRKCEEPPYTSQYHNAILQGGEGVGAGFNWLHDAKKNCTINHKCRKYLYRLCLGFDKSFYKTVINAVINGNNPKHNPILRIVSYIVLQQKLYCVPSVSLFP